MPYNNLLRQTRLRTISESTKDMSI